MQMDEIRRLAERVAASHHLEVVEVEFGGGGKSRALRVYVEKDAAERKRLAERAAAGEAVDVPKGVPVELLSGVTHEDCAAFATDFGTLLDVEDVVPGAEYALEVSSPGLERPLVTREDYARCLGKKARLIVNEDNKQLAVMGWIKTVTDAGVELEFKSQEIKFYPFDHIISGKLEVDFNRRKKDDKRINGYTGTN